eukprot:gene2015-gene1671
MLLLGMPCAFNSLTTTNTAGAASGNKADLLARGGMAGHRGGVANVLMVTTTVRMLNGVAGNTTDLGPAVALAAEAVERVTSLKDGLLNAATTANNANHGAARAGHGLLLAAGELQAGTASLSVVRDNNAVVTGSASQGSTVTGLRLHVAHNAAIGNLPKGKNIANG